MAHAYLEPLLTPGLRVVFVGTEPGRVSLETGNYYANPNNSFWKDLHESGMTSVRLLPHHYRALLGYGIGLDDVYQDPKGFTRRMEKFKPEVVCFNSKGALERIAVIDPEEEWRGAAARELVVFDGVPLVWALPDSSGRASAFSPRAN